MSDNTTDEKLAALRERYPGRIINVIERMVNRDMGGWEQEGFVATAHTVIEKFQDGTHIDGMGDLGIKTIQPTEAEALDALAEALAKLEGKCPKCAEREEGEEALAAMCFDRPTPVDVISDEPETVKGIVAAHLRLAGCYDGLCTDNCGCELADLMPCAASDASSCDTCVPGHKVTVDPEEAEWDRDWTIEPGPRAHSLEPQSERGE